MSDGRQAAAAAATATAGGSDASHGCTSSIRRRGGRFRSGISRFCGGSQVRVRGEVEVGLLFYILHPFVSLCALETASLANSQHTSYISPNTTLFYITQDGSSDEEGSNNNNTSSPSNLKRTARHSIDAEIPNQSISHFYPIDDNYDPHPTDPTLRCPKSLTDLCGKTFLLLCVCTCIICLICNIASILQLMLFFVTPTPFSHITIHTR